MEALRKAVWKSPMVDSHEHMARESVYADGNNDILSDIFNGYIPMDLISAGATYDQIGELLNGSGERITERFQAIQPFWESSKFSGYGEAVREAASLIYGIDNIEADSLEKAQEDKGNRDRHGERLRLLKDVALIDHCQVDDMVLPALPDAEDPEFFKYDLTWWRFSDASFDPKEISELTNTDIIDLASLRRAFDALFDSAPHVVAVKSQHAYTRTLAWEKRSDSEAAAILGRKLRGETLSSDESVILGDWCLGEGVKRATDRDLPFKLHTGYLAHNNNMILENARVSRICPLLKEYLNTRFVLMHIASAFESELLAIVRHYPKAVVDMCWAWAINPFTAKDFVRRYLRQVPVNKLLGFGGDCGNPVNALVYSRQARRGLFDTFKAEIEDGFLTEAEAISISERFMRKNAYEIFPSLTFQ
ncbi:MAG: amidohydrolase family protein [Puniceicoccaceae bacterium]